MKARFILTDYVNLLMTHAVYDKLEDGTYAGRIPTCTGVIAFEPTLRDCEDELRSTLEDWILVGLKLGHPLPVIAEIDLNKEPAYEPAEAL
jgi:predicted RNase H-like HicB family nuclease